MKRKLIIQIIIILTVLILSPSVFANYQSIEGSYTTAVLQSWFYGIREMENPGQALGLNGKDTINNIDVHLQKNTEYGTMLMLATSDYGKQGNGETRSEYISSTKNGLATTTGNTSGVYDLGNYEIVSGGSHSHQSNHTFWDLASKYYNIYSQVTSSEASKYLETSRAGDAMNIYGWQDGGRGNWIYYYSSGGKYTYSNVFRRYLFGFSAITTTDAYRR